ncbi:MAG: hypothetical protein WA485_05805, partial [Candidatus Sulfotelmatobacter sp.]
VQRPLRELVEPKPALLTSALKRKPKMPRIYNLGGRPALAATTKAFKQGGDILSLQLIRHFMVATTGRRIPEVGER